MLGCGRLLQQYIVDMYVKMETQRLDYARHHQSELRACLYQGLDVHIGCRDGNAQSLGRRVVLPSSVTCSPRDMHQRYQDAMALVCKFRKRDILHTITAKAQDRPDLVILVFRLKLEALRDKIMKHSFFGTVAARIDVIEYQKAGSAACAYAHHPSSSR